MFKTKDHCKLKTFDNPIKVYFSKKCTISIKTSEEKFKIPYLF